MQKIIFPSCNRAKSNCVERAQVKTMASIKTGFIVLVLHCFNLLAPCQLQKYQKPSSIDDLHTMYEYRKSNWDGSHASAIFLYVADSNQLQSFKWSSGDKTATLVTALIDWNKFSVSRFTNHRLRKAQPPQLVATLTMDGEKTIRIEVGEMRDSLLLSALPWQSYDFDFAGLSFTWRALKEKKDSFHFHIADAALVNNDMRFVNKGRADVHFTGYEMMNGKNCLKYSIDGPGLENRGGTIWVDAAGFMIEQYKIALPDEPGFENGMLQLVKKEKMKPEQWQAFIKNKLAGSE
jgi:hypothetical protein